MLKKYEKSHKLMTIWYMPTPSRNAFNLSKGFKKAYFPHDIRLPRPYSDNVVNENISFLKRYIFLYAVK